MTWVNLDDQMPEHPKNAALSDAAFRLHISGICYCNRFLTDGKLSAPTVRRLVPNFRPAALAELVKKQIWIEDPATQIYEIRDYLEWNRSRADVEEHRERVSKVRSEAGKKGAAKRWQT